jgi:hypothetical protein
VQAANATAPVSSKIPLALRNIGRL